MKPDDFVTALVRGGSTNLSDFDDDLDYCPVHAWDHSYIGDLHHEDSCPAYAARLKRRLGGS